MRADAVDWLRSNIGLFRDFPQDPRFASADEYLVAMGTGAWGDFHTLIGEINL